VNHRRESGTNTIHLGLLLKAEIESRMVEATGILLADHEALVSLENEGGALRMSEIADRLVLTRGGVTKLVDRLEAAGYVVRNPSSFDRRVITVEITPPGRSAIEGSRAVFDAALHDLWGRHISEEEAEAVLEVVDRIRAALDRSRAAGR
jgi:DNA-binding MarR family transcriptional regulator